jgi:hypothetical protein
MSVGAAADLPRRRLELEPERRLSDEVGGVRPDDVDAERLVGLLVGAFAIAWNGTLPTLYGVPAAFTCSSVRPIEAISGRQYVARGWAL